MVSEQTSQRGALDRSAIVLLSKSEEVDASRDSLKPRSACREFLLTAQAGQERMPDA